MEKILYPTDSVKYFAVKIDSKLNWKSHVSSIATKLNEEMTCSTKEEILSIQIFLNHYIMHYLNHTITMLASYGD